MARIRVAIVGLSANSSSGWGKNAHLPYLLSPRGQERYQIVGLLNSSVESARTAAESFKLPDAANVRAYTSAEDLAADGDVDLVVVSVRVDKHYDAVRPSLAAGKSALVEWPLAENVTRARELTTLAAEAGGRTAVAIQARISPWVLKVKEFLAGGAIGKVISTELRAFSNLQKDNEISVPVKARYFTELKYGGNSYSIAFGHQWDAVQSVFGATNLHSLLQLQHSTIKLVDGENKVVEEVQSDVPNYLNLTGTLPESSIVKKNATLVVNWRRSPAFPDTTQPTLVWTVVGEKGSLRLKGKEGPWLNLSEGFEIEWYDLATGNVEPVEWKWQDWQESLPLPARNIGAIYEAFAEGDETKYATFKDALARHDELDTELAKFLASDTA